jgi:hypothetical protein
MLPDDTADDDNPEEYNLQVTGKTMDLKNLWNFSSLLRIQMMFP